MPKSLVSPARAEKGIKRKMSISCPEFSPEMMKKWVQKLRQDASMLIGGKMDGMIVREDRRTSKTGNAVREGQEGNVIVKLGKR